MGKDLKGKELGKYISQRPNGTYMARFTNRFGKRICFYNVDLKELKKELNDAIYEDEKQLNLADSNMTLNEWYTKWLDIYKSKIRLNSKRFYDQVYTKHIKPYLGKRKLVEINQLMIKNIIKDLDQKGYQYETQNKVKILLVDMFDKAIINDFARKNPARGIKIEHDCNNDTRVLSKEEQSVFFECCKGTFYDNLFTVAVTTGLRPGELCALTWDDIDLEKKTINVNKTLLYQKLEGDEKKTFHIEPPKTNSSSRKVPFGKQCEVALKKQRMQELIVKAQTPKELDPQFENLVFTTKYGTPINSQIYNDAIRAIVDEVNLMRDTIDKFEVFSAHAFRHTFATRCFEANISGKTVQSYLGHSSLKMTMDLYTHVLEDHRNEEMTKLESALDALNYNQEDVDTKYDKLIQDIDNRKNIIQYQRPG